MAAKSKRHYRRSTLLSTPLSTLLSTLLVTAYALFILLLLFFTEFYLFSLIPYAGGSALVDVAAAGGASGEDAVAGGASGEDAVAGGVSGESAATVGRAAHRAIMHSLVVPFFSFDDQSFLSEAEAEHMQDVKSLFNILFELFVISFLSLFFVNKINIMKEKEREKILRLVSYSLGAFVCFILLLFLLGGFGGFWTWFHFLFFPQGNWAFPADSVLIILYPESFFLWYAIIYLVLVTAAASFFWWSTKAPAANLPRTKANL